MTPKTEFDYDPDVTMRELYRRAGFDPDELVHPKNVSPEAAKESVVVAYTTVRNPDIDGPRTTRGFVEWEIEAEDVMPAEKVGEATDGDARYPEDTEVPHAVIWGTNGGLPLVQAINYGDALYGEDSDFDDPERWDRKAGQVTAVADDFVRFRL